MLDTDLRSNLEPSAGAGETIRSAQATTTSATSSNVREVLDAFDQLRQQDSVGHGDRADLHQQIRDLSAADREEVFREIATQDEAPERILAFDDLLSARIPSNPEAADNWWFGLGDFGSQTILPDGTAQEFLAEVAEHASDDDWSSYMGALAERAMATSDDNPDTTIAQHIITLAQDIDFEGHESRLGQAFVELMEERNAKGQRAVDVVLPELVDSSTQQHAKGESTGDFSAGGLRDLIDAATRFEHPQDIAASRDDRLHAQDLRAELFVASQEVFDEGAAPLLDVSSLSGSAKREVESTAGALASLFYSDGTDLVYALEDNGKLDALGDFFATSMRHGAVSGLATALTATRTELDQLATDVHNSAHSLVNEGADEGVYSDEQLNEIAYALQSGDDQSEFYRPVHALHQMGSQVERAIATLEDEGIEREFTERTLQGAGAFSTGGALAALKDMASLPQGYGSAITVVTPIVAFAADYWLKEGLREERGATGDWSEQLLTPRNAGVDDDSMIPRGRAIDADAAAELRAERPGHVPEEVWDHWIDNLAADQQAPPVQQGHLPQELDRDHAAHQIFDQLRDVFLLGR